MGTLFLLRNIGNINKLVLLRNMAISDIMSVGDKTTKTRKRGKSAKMGKPVILRIKLKTGTFLHGARVDYEAPQIDGFLALVGKEINNTTKYIAYDAIEYFTVVNQEACNVKNAFDRRYKVKVDSSL